MPAVIENDNSEYQILAPRTGGPEAHAAQVLQAALLDITGACLPIRPAGQRVRAQPAIRIGAEAAGDASPLWRRDSFEILTEGRDLVLRGSPNRGAIYAVYAFLESLGMRNFGPGAVHLPRLKRVDLPETPVRSTAAFWYRHVFYPAAQEPEWALPWRLNVHNGRDARWGAAANAHSFGHSFSRLVPPAVHFSGHPEYYALVDGHRRRQGAQLCCTSAEVAAVACRSLQEQMAGHPGKRIFAVGMNDCHGWCECEHCAAVDRREGGPIGQLLTLVNRVAERFPDSIIATLAYSSAVEPPRQMRAAENVLIVLCHNEGCFTHALDACEANEKFLRRLEGWQQRSSHLLIWDYYVNYRSYLMPTPNFRRIARDLRAYRDAGAAGMFCQGSAVRGGQFEVLRQYLLARLLWDPDADAEAIMHEWLAGVFGPRAGGYVLDYLTMLEDHVRDAGAHMLSFAQAIQPEIFTPEILRRGAELWDAAERCAESEDAHRRIVAARAPEMLSRLFSIQAKYRIDDGKLRPEPVGDPDLRDRFVAAALAGGAAHLRENAYAPESFGRDYGRSYDVVTLCNDTLEIHVVPEMAGRVFSLRYRPLGVEVMHVGDLFRLLCYLPYGDGYEFSFDRVWQGRGTREEAEVVQDASPDSVVLRCSVDGNLELTTEYTLRGAEVQLAHHVRNVGDRPVTISPAAKAKFDLAAFGEAAMLHLAGPDTGGRTVPINPDGRGTRDVPFEGERMPAGRWRLDSAVRDLSLTQSFSADAVERTSLALRRRNDDVQLTVDFSPRTLACGEVRTYGTAWILGPRGS